MLMPPPYKPSLQKRASCTLWFGDCLVEMQRIAAGSIDLILCDLPYGVTACKWDAVIPFEPLWAQYRRVLKANGVVALTATQPFTSALVMSNPAWFRIDWIWEKQKGTNFQHARRRPLKVHESALIFSPTATHTYNPQMTDLDRHEYRKPAAKTKTQYLTAGSSCATTTRGGTYNGRYPRTVQYFVSESMNGGSLHPTQKPVALMEYLIRTYTNAGETVLDNCMGSGTTGVACRNLGRNFIGIENDPQHFATAKARLA